MDNTRDHDALYDLMRLIVDHSIFGETDQSCYNQFVSNAWSQFGGTNLTEPELKSPKYEDLHE